MLWVSGVSAAPAVTGKTAGLLGCTSSAASFGEVEGGLIPGGKGLDFLACFFFFLEGCSSSQNLFVQRIRTVSDSAVTDTSHRVCDSLEKFPHRDLAVAVRVELCHNTFESSRLGVGLVVKLGCDSAALTQHAKETQRNGAVVPRRAQHALRPRRGSRWHRCQTSRTPSLGSCQRGLHASRGPSSAPCAEPG